LADGDRERWDARWATGRHHAGADPDWLEAVPELPRTGLALDLACGVGRVALWLARRGLRTVAIDVSPVALERAEIEARALGLSLETRALDLERDPLPEGPWDLIACFQYLQRDLFPALRERLAPGGSLVCEIATRRNLERHAHPSARFLLEENELLALCTPLHVTYYREAWLDDRHLARIAAQHV
jgi:SAM-dependent methyltransferase